MHACTPSKELTRSVKPYTLNPKPYGEQMVSGTAPPPTLNYRAWPLAPRNSKVV